MVEYREIKNAKKLKAIEFTMADVPMLSHGQQVNISTDLGGPDRPQQLNIRHINDVTYVQPAGGDHSELPFKFSGYVSPADCRAWYLATVEAQMAEGQALDAVPASALVVEEGGAA